MSDEVIEEAQPAPSPQIEAPFPDPLSASLPTEAEGARSGVSLSLYRIGRVLDTSRDEEERNRAVEQLLPLFWDRAPWVRYKACRTLTLRIFLPYALSVLEWGSFPHVFARALRKQGYRAMPSPHEKRRTAVVETLCKMLATWYHNYLAAGSPISGGRGASMDVGADICEAIGRLGVYEAERDLLSIIESFGNQNNQVRISALVAIAALPPDRLENVWRILRTGQPRLRRMLAATITYMTHPDAVPHLIDLMPYQIGPSLEDVAQPLLMALGTIGDTRALPTLNAIARDETHPLRPTARKAIQRLMKEAAGHEEVTLVRASDLSSLNPDILLRPVNESGTAAHPDELLRPTGSEAVSETPDA